MIQAGAGWISGTRHTGVVPPMVTVPAWNHPCTEISVWLSPDMRVS